MSVTVEDPLIDGMAISHVLPVHESGQRFRALYPETPRVYGVAVMSDVSRRRWWPLSAALHTDRIEQMFATATADLDRRTAAQQLAAMLAHAVIGRVVALFVLDGRAWDAGLENLWVHVDSEGTIDWLGITDPTLRVLPDDPALGGPGIMELPNEAALATWTAHRCHRSLAPLFEILHRVSGGATTVASMWHTVGVAIVVASTQIPLRAGANEATAMRRGQAVLDALVTFGLPVREQPRIQLRNRAAMRPIRRKALHT